MNTLRRSLCLALAVLALVFFAPGTANAATVTRVQLVTTEVVRQAPTDPLGQLRAVGGAILIAPGGERLASLRGRYEVDLSGLQCSFVERSDRIVLRFSAADSLTVHATGSSVSTDGCAGRSFHRVLTWRVVGGTGRYADVRGNGTATGTLLSRPEIDYATSRMVWRGVLVR